MNKEYAIKLMEIKLALHETVQVTASFSERFGSSPEIQLEIEKIMSHMRGCSLAHRQLMNLTPRDGDDTDSDAPPLDDYYAYSPGDEPYGSEDES